jgi:DNA repair protein RadD
MASAMAAKHLDRSPTNRVVWLAHRSELIDQATGTLERLGIDMPRVSVESIQGLLRRTSVPHATLVIQDECHHMVSDEWSRLNTAWPGAWRVGLTATPERGDGRGLGIAFDDIVVAARHAELLELGHLVPCSAERPGRILKAGQIAQRPIDAYLEFTPGQQAVVFAQHVKAAEEHVAEFRDAGIQAALVTGKTPWSERCATIAAFREGRGRVLVNVNVLTEGFDAPETSCCIIARGVGHPGMFLQMVGRAVRPAPGKTGATLLDLRGVSWAHGSVEDEREYSLVGKGIRLKSEPGARFCQVCGAVMADDSTSCDGCGRTAPPLELPKVTNDPLEKQRKAEAVPEATKIGKLAYWIREARAHGHKPGAPFQKFKAIYFIYPSDKIQREAQKMAGPR